jgi:hypothetical protein
MMSTGATVNLRKLEERLARKPLDEIATLIQGLTYGEMIELAQVMWKSHPEGSAITQDNLPALLHRWSKSNSAKAHDVLEEAPSSSDRHLRPAPSTGGFGLSSGANDGDTSISPA